MPNFAGSEYGLAAWRDAFVEQWPEGSDAHASYWCRITHGPRYGVDLAMRAA